MTYDLIIIGGGPAGYMAAERAGHAGLNTLLIEKRAIGGVCLNEGCIPSKTLLHSAKIYDYAKAGSKYGVICGEISLSHRTVIERKNRVVRILVSGIKARLKKYNVNIIEDTGIISGKNGDDFAVKAGNEIYFGSRLLIATGSVPVIPPIAGVADGIQKGFVLTNREMLDIETVPTSLAVIGGGVVGLEMASYFNSAGSKVTVVELLDRIAGNTDLDISKILMKNYEKKGIEFRIGSKVTGIGEGTVTYDKDGQTATITVEKALMSVGRKPFTAGAGIESIGVEIYKSCVRTDETGRTNIPGVYAAGDVNGNSMLAHTAYREAEVCINNILGKKDIMRYNAIPSVIYTNPEVALVGETEESAKQKSIEFEAANISMRFSGRYVAENEGGDGICKVLVDKKHRKLIGVHMIGSYASEIIYGAGLMIESEMRVKDIRELVFPHPTVSEIIREGIFTFDA